MKPYSLHAAPYRTAEQAEAGRLAKAKQIKSDAEILRSAAAALDEIASSGVSDSTMTHAANFILETLK